MTHAAGVRQCAVALAAFAIVSACGGSTVAPSVADTGIGYIGTSAIPVAGAQPKVRAMPGFPAIVPAAQSQTYEYVFNTYGTYASMFNYPKSTKMIGQIRGAGGQGCTNAQFGYGKRIIWNVGGPTQIDEYRVPSNKLLKTLSVNYFFASSCAMDTSGDLAVGILYATSSGGGGEIVIFKNATGSGTVYTTPLAKEYFDGYDPSGNLFADGTDSSYGFRLVELPKGSTKAVTITTSNSPEFPGSVQWDGTYLSVLDQVRSRVYRYTLHGTKATLAKTVDLMGAGDCTQTWIVKGLLYCGDAGNSGGEVFSYPAGGLPIATFTGTFDFPLGVTAAKK